MAIRAGMTIAEAILQLTKGFRKMMGRDPDGLEKIKIQQEAVKRIEEVNKVVDMEGNVIDTSKGIMGGKQIQDSPEFGSKIRETYDKAKGPGKGQEMVDALKSPGAKKSYEIIEDQLGVKLYGDETFEEIMEIQKTGKHPRGEPKAEGGRIGLKEGNGKDDSLTGITMTIEERMKRIRKLMEELEKAKKGIGIDPDPEDDLGGGGDFGSFKDFIENAAGATGDFELLDLYDDFLKTGDDSKMMSRLKKLGYDMTDNFAAGGIAGMLGE